MASARMSSKVVNAKLPRKGLTEKWLEELVGQDHIVDAIVPSVSRWSAGLGAPKRPQGIFLLLGKTGTGKTYTAETLANVLHGDPSMLMIVNGGEYEHAHEIAKLLGPPPGYLGHRETKPLFSNATFDKIRSNSCNLAIICIDEVEKMHSAAHRLFLGIFDKGVMIDGENVTTSFENTIVLMTSNLGAREMTAKALGFNGGMIGQQERLIKTTKQLEQISVASAKRKFSPEFMNRIDQTLTFRTLDEEDIKKILDLELSRVTKLILERLGGNYFNVNVLPAARKRLITEGYSAEYGARNIKRIVQRKIMDPVVDMYINDEVKTLETVQVGIRGGELAFTVLTQAEAKGAA